MLPFGSSPLLHFSNPSSFHKLGVNSSFISKSQEFCCWLYRDQAFSRCLLPPLQIQKPVHTLRSCVSRALQGAAHTLLLPFGSLHPSTPPSPLKGAPPAPLCMLTLASLCIRCATLVSHQQRLVIWQALEDTERLVSFHLSSVSLAVLLIQSVFFCI